MTLRVAIFVQQASRAERESVLAYRSGHGCHAMVWASGREEIEHDVRAPTRGISSASSSSQTVEDTPAALVIVGHAGSASGLDPFAESPRLRVIVDYRTSAEVLSPAATVDFIDSLTVEERLSALGAFEFRQHNPNTNAVADALSRRDVADAFRLIEEAPPQLEDLDEISSELTESTRASTGSRTPSMTDDW